VTTDTASTATAHAAAIDLEHDDKGRLVYVPACHGCDWTAPSDLDGDAAQDTAAGHADNPPRPLLEVLAEFVASVNAADPLAQVAQVAGREALR
jgi:hypothetical protein